MPTLLLLIFFSKVGIAGLQLPISLLVLVINFGRKWTSSLLLHLLRQPRQLVNPN